MNTLKKYQLDMVVRSVSFLNANHAQLVLCPLDEAQPLPTCLPGQFVQVQVENAAHVLLRRPISINFADNKKNELSLLVQAKGEGTERLVSLQPGDVVNIVFPLGNGFNVEASGASPLLIGGGVGVAPLLYLGAVLKAKGITPTFLLGARSKDLLLQLPAFEALGTVYVTTEDGSMGEKGFVTNHTVWTSKPISHAYVCGPMPMMKAVATLAAQQGIDCEVSLENLMACGLGACLCCVEKTTKGHVCVCTEGPVFNTKQLLWQS